MIIKAKKSLGQNFLQDPNIKIKIYNTTLGFVDKLDLAYKNYPMIEIGPGLGDLTEEFIKIKQDLTLYEIDDDLIEGLKVKFPKLNVINQDFMKMIPNLEKAILVSNLPYYIGSRLIIDLIAYNKNLPFAFILQREVSNKVKVSEDITFFGAAINLFYTPKVEFVIPPQAFKPSPKVYSALLTAAPKVVKYNGLETVTILKAMFFKPTKTLFNNLIYGGFDREDVKRIFEKHNIEPNTRVRWANYVEIFDILYNEFGGRLNIEEKIVKIEL
jgi:16S rRNA (adenine1518-N6/adenine1519-N6)-dimethyltransferase